MTTQCVKFLGRENGGNQAELSAARDQYPWLQKICGNQTVSVLRFIPADEMAADDYPVNGSGKLYLIKKGEVTQEIDWNEILMHRKERHMQDISLRSPQTEITGSEEACVNVQFHEERERGQKWISVDVFLSPPHSTFNNSSKICKWFAVPAVRSRLAAANFPLPV